MRLSLLPFSARHPGNGVYLCLLLLCSCMTGRQRCGPLAPLPPESSFNRDAGQGQWLRLTLRIEDGEELLFEVDTGSPVTVLDKSLEPRLGPRLAEKTLTYAWKQVTGGIYPAPKLFLGGVQLHTGSQVWTDDLTRGRSRGSSEPAVMGILGMDCLRHYCVQMDFTTSTIRFLKSGQVVGQDLGKASPIFLSDAGVLFLRDSFLTTKRLAFIIDTGCLCDGVIEPKEFHRFVLNQPDVLSREWQDPIGMRRYTAWLSKGVWNGEVYHRLCVDQSPAMAYRGKRYYLNAMGLPFLARHLVTLDFPHRTMYLKRTPLAPRTAEAPSTHPTAEAGQRRERGSNR